MPIEDLSPSIQEDIALLSDGEETPSKDEKVEAKVEPEKEEKSEQEEPEQEEEPEKELAPHERPTLDQIKKAYPDIFKKFPSLRDAFYRERQFSEVFHTPQEARESAELAQEYEDLRDDVINGDGERLLPALKESDSLPKFAKSFLSNLYKTDKDLHYQVILPVLEDAVRLVFQRGIKSGKENLQNAARVMAIELFDEMDVAEGKKTFVEPLEKKDSKLDSERQNYENQRYNDFKIDVHEQIHKSLISEIDKGLKVEGLTDFMKKSIRQEIIDSVVNTVRADKAHMKYVDRLWLDAKKGGYRGESKARIIDASLARAKGLIPSLRRSLITEALGSSPAEGKRKQEVVAKVKSRVEPGSQGKVSGSVKMPSARKINWNKTSDMDILNGKYTLKG